jgi:thioredoxin 2
VVWLLLIEKLMADSSIIRCASCGATNRVPNDKLQQQLQPVCGRCKSALPIATKPIIVTDATFTAEVTQSPVPVLLDLWAPWCGPCRMIAPTVEELAREMMGRIRVAKLNVDENPSTAGRFQVRSIPTLLLFKHGKEVSRMVGAQPKAEIKRRLRSLVA